MATNIFISYAKEDADYLAELETHLALLKREGIIRTWHLGCVAPGSPWEDELRAQLESAEIIVVLVSADFFASKHCCDAELEHASRRAAFGKALLIPILVRPCVWRAPPFEYRPVFPKSGRPISTWPDRDEAWTEIAQMVLDAVRDYDERAALMADRQRTFLRTPTSASGFSFARVCLNPSDDHWGETTTPLLPYPSPFSADPGQYLFLRDLFSAESGALGLDLDITVMNHSSVPLLLTKIGIEIVAVAHTLDGHGDGVPTKVRKSDSYVLDLPDVREILNSKFPDLHDWDSKGPVALDLVVSVFLEDPILLPSTTPYRYGLRLAGYAHKMPNHSLIRAWAQTTGGEATSTCLDVFTN